MHTAASLKVTHAVCKSLHSTTMGVGRGRQRGSKPPLWILKTLAKMVVLFNFE